MAKWAGATRPRSRRQSTRRTSTSGVRGRGGRASCGVLDERVGALRMGVGGGELIHRFRPFGGGRRLPWSHLVQDVILRGGPDGLVWPGVTARFDLVHLTDELD